jgi:hypothetical protein
VTSATTVQNNAKNRQSARIHPLRRGASAVELEVVS